MFLAAALNPGSFGNEAKSSISSGGFVQTTSNGVFPVDLLNVLLKANSI